MNVRNVCISCLWHGRSGYAQKRNHARRAFAILHAARGEQLATTGSPYTVENGYVGIESALQSQAPELKDSKKSSKKASGAKVKRSAAVDDQLRRKSLVSLREILRNKTEAREALRSIISGLKSDVFDVGGKSLEEIESAPFYEWNWKTVIMPDVRRKHPPKEANKVMQYISNMQLDESATGPVMKMLDRVLLLAEQNESKSTKSAAPKEGKAARKARSTKATESQSIAAEPRSFELEVKAERLNVAKLAPDQIRTLVATDAKLHALNVEAPDVPGLSFDLQRVLFNPGVYQLQDPRSRIYNFDPYLEKIMPVTEFNFDALNEYITSSKDSTLLEHAVDSGKRYVGSSSSMTGVLSHFHFLLSAYRPLNFSTLSKGFRVESQNFTRITMSPGGIFLRYRDGVYGVDADKEHDEGNILMSMGKSVEKLLTMEKDEYEKFRKSVKDDFDAEAQKPEQYHYGTIGNILMRSQLDAHDPRLPGTGMFDLKTRAVAAIRMYLSDHEVGQGYEIKGRFGQWESFEREYYDMMRSTFLKYSLQARMGRMDGIFVAFHNIERMFGFQYVSVPEMDLGLHGQLDTSLGNQEFGYSVRILEDIFDRATERYPNQTLRLYFETRPATEKVNPVTYMNIFVEPMADEEVDKIQAAAQDKIDAYERQLFSKDSELADDEAEDEDEEEDQEDSEDADDEAAANVATSSEMQVKETEDTSTNVLKADSHNSASGGAISGGKVMVNSDGTASSSDGNASSAAPTTPRGVRDGPRVDFEGDSAFLDSLTDMEPETQSSSETRSSATKSNPPAAKRAPVLGFKIVARHEVNGQYVGRPERLTSNDVWNVDYTIEEMDAGRAAMQYHLCKARKEAVLKNLSSKDSGNNMYINNLIDMSEDGRRWRKERDEMDAGREQVMLYEEGK